MRKPIKKFDEDLSHLKESSIAICGLAQNCATKINKNIDFINRLSNYFKNSFVIVVENDSKDATRKILEDWASFNSQVFIIQGVPPAQATECENLDNPFANFICSSVSCPNPYYSRRRITRMATLRNQYMDKLCTLKNSFDYLLVMDFDIDKISLEGVLDSLIKEDKWDVVTAYGYSLSPLLMRRYHDTFALIPLDQKTSYIGQSNLQTEYSIKYLQNKWRLDNKYTDLIPVYAAFGGLTIYKFKLVENLRYQVLPNFNDRVEVLCEHVSICDFLHKSGNISVVINPKMKLRYQTLYDSVVRYLSFNVKISNRIKFRLFC